MISIKRILAQYEATLRMIAGDYPNATKEYKRSWFVVGAQDLFLKLFDDQDFVVKRLAAKYVDCLRLIYFGDLTDTALEERKADFKVIHAELRMNYVQKDDA